MTSIDVPKILYQDTIKYLHDISDKLPGNCDVLKSYYTSKFRILEERGNVYLPKSGNKNFRRCPRCCLKYDTKNTSYSVKAEEQKPKFAKKVLNKLKKNKVLTRYQEEYAKKISKVRQNHLVVTCGFCKKDVARPLDKPEKPKPPLQIAKHIHSKKKKKDKFCGLQKEAVIAVQGQSSDITINNVITNNKKVIVKKKKKNIKNLTKMLTQSAPSDKKKANLHNFLESFK